MTGQKQYQLQQDGRPPRPVKAPVRIIDYPSGDTGTRRVWRLAKKKGYDAREWSDSSTEMFERVLISRGALFGQRGLQKRRMRFD